MPTQLRHNGGLVDAIIELGFDAVKYFELTANGTAQMLTLSPPARRLTLHNESETDDVYFNITGDNATTSVGPIPGDNIKLGPLCSFTMDFDTLTQVSFITSGANVMVEGLIGWKATTC